MFKLLRFSNKKEYLLVIVISASLLFLAISGWQFYSLQRRKAENEILREQIVALNSKAGVLKRKIKESEDKISKVEQELKNEKSKVKLLTDKLAAEKKARINAFQQLISLESRLKEEKARTKKAQEDLGRALSELERLKREVQTLIADKQSLTAQLQKLTSKKVSLGSVVVNSSSQKSSADEVDIEGKVIAVVKEYNFCVIDVGSINGVREGDLFSLYHRGRYLGDIKIDKVKESLAAGEFLSPSLGRILKKGDKAIYKRLTSNKTY